MRNRDKVDVISDSASLRMTEHILFWLNVCVSVRVGFNLITAETFEEFTVYSESLFEVNANTELRCIDARFIGVHEYRDR